MLNTDKWEEFSLDRLFEISAGKYYYSDEYEDGLTPYISASANNNGISQRISRSADFKGNVIVTGKVGCTAFYQIEDFCATSDVNILKPKRFELNPKIGMFLVSIINFSENYKWSYGRQCRIGDSKRIVIKLPVELDNSEKPIIDNEKNFSDEGFIPDWKYMEKFIEVIESRESACNNSIKNLIVTNNNHKIKQKLNISDWSELKISNIFDVKYGVNLEVVNCIETTKDDVEAVNFVSRTSMNNGVSTWVKKIENITPQEAYTITCAGGGSVLSTFLQTKPFYSGRDLYLLIPKDKNMSKLVKLFFCTIIKANQYKYSYGRQANKTLPDILVKVPIKKGCPIEYKYIDYELIEKYMSSLPYGDRV